MQRSIGSNLTSKFQTIVPKEVREVLSLTSKDKIIYEILEDNTVIIRKASPLDITYLRGLDQTLHEWNSDEQAYKDL